MANGGFEDLPQRHDLIVDRAARRGFPLKGTVRFGFGVWLKSRGHPVHPVFLHFPRRHPGHAEVAEKGEEVKAQPDAMALDPTRTSLAFGDDPVFLEELIRRLAERLFRDEEASAVFPAQSKIPVFCHLFCEGETLLLGARSALFAADRCRALPETAVVASVNLELSSDERVAFHRLTMHDFLKNGPQAIRFRPVCQNVLEVR